MYRFYLAAVDMLPGILILAPAYWILNKTFFRNNRKSFFYFMFSCYLAVVYVLVGLPNVTYIRPEVNLNLIPMVGMISDFKNSLLNILLFVPLGAMLPVLWNKFRTQRYAVIFGFCSSLFIELLQMLTFRATDVNDLITNTLGTYLGFCFAKRLFKRKSEAGNSTGEAGMVIGIVLLVMFFVYPFVSSALWDFILG